AVLHDIGTVGVSDEILQQAGPLEDGQRDEVRRHAEMGARILATAELDGVAELVLAHHERPDGGGYPNGLKGDEIPIGAQIIAVADAYAAMTGDRAYAAAISPEEAREEIRAGGGTQFDPAVVEAFLEIAATLEPEPVA